MFTKDINLLQEELQRLAQQRQELGKMKDDVENNIRFVDLIGETLSDKLVQLQDMQFAHETSQQDPYTGEQLEFSFVQDDGATGAESGNTETVTTCAE